MMRRLLFLASLVALFLPLQALAQGLFVSAEKQVTAGEQMPFSVSGLMTHESVNITLERPGGSEIDFVTTADEWGRALDKVHALHLREAGLYKLKATRSLDPYHPVKHSFVVQSGAISPHKSQITLTQPTAEADGEARIFFNIALVDDFGNPVHNAPVEVISSRNADLVQHDLQSRKGRAKGYVISGAPGVSTLSVFVDGKALFDKPEMVFHLPQDLVARGADGGLGAFLKAQLFEDDEVGEVAYFTVEGLEERILAGNTETFRVTAKDQDGEVVPNYFGTVRFASTDDQAELPADYLFDEKDQGSHEFALSVTFNTLGRHNISVHDLSDFRIAGEIEFEVVDSLEPNVTIGDPSVEILSPTEGTYRSARVTITGRVGGGVERVRIMDGSILLVDDLETDGDGAFVYQTAALANGVHEFQAFDVENRAVSQKVAITIDRLPPRVLAVEIDPAKAAYEPGESFNLKISASEPLSRADCVLLENNYEFSQQGDSFIATMQAPLECGEYVIGCAVADMLGNELQEPNASRIKVCAPEIPEVEGGAEGEPEPEPEPEPTDIAPTAPLNLTGIPDVDKVTLFWSPSTDDEGIGSYKVYYGNTPGQFNNHNEIPDDRTRWYINDLMPNTAYYFNVSAVDVGGLEGEVSETIEVRTLPPTKIAGDDELDETGSSWWISIVFALLGVMLIRFGIARES